MILIVLLMLGTNQICAQLKKENFKVLGNCDTCEKRIEKAAMSVKGVVQADWDAKSKMIKLAFNTAETTLDQIHLAIVKAGYDTDKHKAKSKSYHGLPGCCRFDRPK